MEEREGSQRETSVDQRVHKVAFRGTRQALHKGPTSRTSMQRQAASVGAHVVGVAAKRWQADTQVGASDEVGPAVFSRQVWTA